MPRVTGKTHHTAIVLVPPEDVWEPIQAIRRRHDRQVRRWMPHVTLLYPFRSSAEFDRLEPALRAACARIVPFAVRLALLRVFDHGPRSHTLWLAPEAGGDSLRRLQASLQAAVPDCDDVSRHAEGFTPHLSVGQARGDGDAVARVHREILAGWRPVEFTACDVCLIRRGDAPDDVFRVDRRIPLAGAAAGAR
jgi:RNA 2',3'-cyclic 3'-phosphodiesterase